jgi:hypothetical protein
MATKMRVKETRWVRAGDLLAHPRNWRQHPEYQRAALKGVLDEVGFASVLVAYEDEDGLRLIDGHLRAETEPDLQVPVAVLDVTAAEAEKILATFDPIAAMARPNQDVLLDLLSDATFGDKAVNDMLMALANGAEFNVLDQPIAPDDFKEFDEGIETQHSCPKCGYVWSGGK